MSDVNTKDIDLLREMHQKSHEARDKALLALCSASLALTLTFFDKIFVGELPILLYTVWCLLAASMLATLYSYCTAAKTADRLEIYNHNKEKYQDDIKFCRSLNFWFNLTHWLNRVSVNCFTLAVWLFIIFAIVNVKSKIDMENNNSSNKQIINGLTPPTSMMPQKTVDKGAPPTTSMMPPKNPSAPAKPAGTEGSGNTSSKK